MEKLWWEPIQDKKIYKQNNIKYFWIYKLEMATLAIFKFPLTKIHSACLTYNPESKP